MVSFSASWGYYGVCPSLGTFPPAVLICVMTSQSPQSIWIDITPIFSSSLCRMRWELHPKQQNRWKKTSANFYWTNFSSPHVLESTDLRNVLFLGAALTWILFVYGLVFVHTLKVGFCFYSDKASSLLSSSKDESFPTKSLEFLWLLQVWVWFWFWGFFFLLLQSSSLTTCLSFICAGCSWNWNTAHLSLFCPVCFGSSPQFVKDELWT